MEISRKKIAFIASGLFLILLIPLVALGAWYALSYRRIRLEGPGIVIPRPKLFAEVDLEDIYPDPASGKPDSASISFYMDNFDYLRNIRKFQNPGNTIFIDWGDDVKKFFENAMDAIQKETGTRVFQSPNAYHYIKLIDKYEINGEEAYLLRADKFIAIAAFFPDRGIKIALRGEEPGAEELFLSILKQIEFIDE